MCGILGLLTRADSPLGRGPRDRVLRRLFELSESRGKESSGIAARKDGTIHVFRHPRPAAYLIESPQYRRIAAPASDGGNRACLIGHSRMATNGAPEANRNNQPLVKDGVVGVHNGIITNDARLWELHPGLRREHEVDTEVLLALLRMSFDETGSLEAAACRTYALIEGMASLAALFADADRLLLATNNGSLYVYPDRENGVFLFASEEHHLRSLLAARFFRARPETIRQVRPRTACLVDLETLEAADFGLDAGAAAPERRRGGTLAIVDHSDDGPAGPGPARRRASPAVPVVTAGYDSPRPLRRCSRCILPHTMPFISFDADGVCNFCRDYRAAAPRGEAALRLLVEPFRSRSGRPDCIVALSGGRDSSYALHYIKNVLCMNPVAFSYDWGMMTDAGRRNQSRMCAKTGVEHILISADIPRKREFIRQNVMAWLRSPHLGTVPLFMAGDKQFYMHAYQLRRQHGIALVFLGEHPLECTNFKAGFCGARLTKKGKMAYSIPTLDKLKMLFFYARECARNQAYLNASLLDTLEAFFSFYVLPHDYLNLYDFIPWDEREVISTLVGRYNWEGSPDTKSTWRIDDGTAAFYNYIYFKVAGLSEHDTFLCNQIREGTVTREEALRRSAELNQPRLESLRWYCDTIGLDLGYTLQRINATPNWDAPRGGGAGQII
jgi:predicted glutamine amidotransferase